VTNPPDLINKSDIYRVVPLSVLKEIVKNFRFNPVDSDHGFLHWARVLENGLILSDFNGANKNIIIAFSFFHDSKRENETLDPFHGDRGANYLLKLKDKINLTQDEVLKCFTACKSHTDKLLIEDTDISTCWDADRLDLMRVNIFPEKDKLNGYISRESAIITLCNKRAIQNTIPEWAKEVMDDIGL
jgi:uncharacterized protein